MTAVPTPPTDLLLGAAADVLRSFGDTRLTRHVAIIGGLVPTLITGHLEPPAPHEGTGDLDLLLRLQLLEGETDEYYGSIIEGLRSLGLRPTEHEDRLRQWRWSGRHRDIHLIVDLLSADPEQAAPVPRAVSRTAANVGAPDEIRTLPLAYGDLVEIDRRVIRRDVDSADGRIDQFSFPVAGIASWLALKGQAIELRRRSKDAYDVVWTLSTLDEEAREQLRASPLWASAKAKRAASGLAALFAQFATTEHIGCQQYAAHLGAAGPSDGRLRRDAREVVTRIADSVADLVTAGRDD